MINHLINSIRISFFENNCDNNLLKALVKFYFFQFYINNNIKIYINNKV